MGGRIGSMESNTLIHWLMLALLAATISFLLKKFAK